MRARLALAALAAAIGTAEAADRQNVERVETRRSVGEGQYLIDGNGRTLYRFTGDVRDEGGTRRRATAATPARRPGPPC